MGEPASEGRKGGGGPTGVAGERRDARTLADRLYTDILRRIHDGSLGPETRLPSEAALARSFAVSRPVVREALARLRDHGLIASRRGSGSWVRRPVEPVAARFAPVASIADVLRCFEFRLTFEGRSAALAAERHTSASLTRIEAAHGALDPATAGEHGAEDADFRFHQAIAEAAGNHFFSSTLAMLEEQIRTATTLARSLGGPRVGKLVDLVRAEHGRILDAIRAREPARAEKAMVEHIVLARRRLIEGDDGALALRALDGDRPTGWEDR